MKTYPNQLFCEPLPDHLKMSISFAINQEEVKPKPGSAKGVEYDYIFTVGQMIQHTAQSNEPILSVQWVINGGAPLANYTVTAGAGVVYPLTPQLRQTNPMFCAYSLAGPVTVGAYITTSSGTGYVQVSVLLTAPQVNMFEAATEQVYVGQFLGAPWIRFGNPANPALPGITINAVTYGQQNVPGTLGILQLATNMRVGSDNDHNTYHWNLNGQPVLDVGPGGAYVFYQNETAQLNSGQNAQFDVTDAPGSQLGPPFTLLSIGDGNPDVVPESYQAYLMFRPITFGSIFVPLSVLNWNWAGYSTLQGINWSPVQDPQNLVNPVGTLTNVFPTWTTNTNTGHWVAGLGANLGVRNLGQRERLASN